MSNDNQTTTSPVNNEKPKTSLATAGRVPGIILNSMYILLSSHKTLFRLKQNFTMNLKIEASTK